MSSSRRKAYNQSTKIVLYYLASLLNMRPPELREKMNKKEIFSALIDKINSDKVALETLASYHTPKPSNHAVLGIDIMEAVWADMKNTQLPSWIGTVPHNWGTAARGKLSADNWRVICTIHLPITLIRLWAQETGRRRDILENFMDLVAAVRIANMRVSSQNQIIAYNQAMERYVAGLQRLYPNFKLKPTHHVSLHIGDILKLFGPVHSHSAPFFERYINFLHRINTNQKLGELEGTFMRAAARSANIRTILAEDEDIRQVVLEMVNEMETIALEDIRGFRRASMLDHTLSDWYTNSATKQKNLQEHEHQLFCSLIGRIFPDRVLGVSPRVLAVDEISLRGVCYGTSDSSKYQNSTILFKPETQAESQPLKAGIIQTIFREHQFPSSRDPNISPAFYVVVQEHRCVNIADDPYRRYGFSGGFLCTNEPIASHIIEISRIVSHFALTRFKTGNLKNYFHVMPLDRLMLSFDFEGTPIQAQDPRDDL
ncbi:hypothetical protein BDZ94DRAFT_1327649 [Collybia nuda]|uniref:DUF4218 domain-containing protein n=1 Tax=Collybia nuda TaxID=64659 RepID=A0A9P6C7M8_9AGAR|nr:hypothetical protein BDZ94DRAFT_1327649 [Collybia nuda]